MIFVGAIAAVALYEWRKLVLGFAHGLQQAIWIVFGVLFIGFAAAALVAFRQAGPSFVIFPVLVTILTDIGAYFTGRALGGPKIAPAVSPSKTWSGLFGGMIAAGLGAAWWNGQFGFLGHWPPQAIMEGISWGVPLAVVAQAGDFLESWMKRRAGVKDSGAVIPGHGGVLDRIDGLLAVTVIWASLNVYMLATRL
jgi:phosphatidate cytidylyltransferase